MKIYKLGGDVFDLSKIEVVSEIEQVGLDYKFKVIVNGITLAFIDDNLEKVKKEREKLIKEWKNENRNKLEFFRKSKKYRNK